MTLPTETALQQVVFLDTNAIHYSRLFLAFASKHGLPPFGACTDDPEQALKKTHGDRGKTLDSHLNGFKIANYLKKQCIAGWQAEYAPISRLEMFCGLLRGASILHAAAEAITLRMWNRIEEKDILGWLERKDYEAVVKDAEGFIVHCSSFGITVSETNPEHIKDVWSLACVVLGNVYLDLGDCIVYASALLAEADELLTADGYFRFVANAIENPGGIMDPAERTFFEQVKTNLIDAVAKSIGIDATKVSLPKAPKSW